MDNRDIRPEQAREIHETLMPTLGYLNKLLQRMDQRGFPDEDPYCKSAIAARDALHDLCVKTHLMSCVGGDWEGRRGRG